MVAERIMPYKLFTIEKKIELKILLGHGVDLQDVLRFSEGTDETNEELHYEDSPDPTATAYEILVPIDRQIELLISPREAQAGTPGFGAFLPVTVGIKQGIVIYPKTCHYVKQAGRFMVLKAKGGWKFSRHADTAAGVCIYQDTCDACEDCPSPR
jgi:hypothetical protein